MFKVVAEPRKRRVWSSRTVAASVGVHLLLVAGIATAAETRKPPVEVTEFDIGAVPPEQPKPVRVVAPPPVDQPRPEPVTVKGQTVQIPAPEKVPDTLPPPDPNATRITPDMVTGVGKVGNAFGTPDPNPAPPPATPPGDGGENLPRWDGVATPDMVDVQPELANRSQAQMALQRAYPPQLRDVGVVGHTTVQLVIDAEGKVMPGSVQVQESSHEAFNAAAVRAVERFRFRPARLHGRTVPVLVTLPISWELEN
ncbi:MAG TPA: TonB family protein [Longimicrobium sp.]|nr:TonB family protein [Longimicrobium sp.]